MSPTGGPEPPPRPLPSTWRLVPAAGLRRRDRGRILLGGSPWRSVRLTPTGAARLDALLAGAPIGTDPDDQRLARLLIERGLGHPAPDDPGGAETPAGPAIPDDVTVVIPVRDDPDGLLTTLEHLLGSGPRVSGPDTRRSPAVIVVDDGSVPPVGLDHRSGGRRDQVRLVRSARSEGPAGARNRGTAMVDTPLVAYLDAGVIAEPADLARLARHFEDAATVAVAPRVRPRAGGTPAIDRYEAKASPLDLGPAPGRVRPGERLSYVPGTALMIRRRALAEVGPFDPMLRYGEDVDLVWRLHAIGTVRYDPSVVVSHPNRASLRALATQRFGYGSAAGPLARRHGATVAPVRGSAAALAVPALVMVGAAPVAVAVQAWSTRRLARALSPLPDAGVEATLVAAANTASVGRAAARAVVRSWWPLTLVALCVRPTRRLALRALALATIELLARHRGPAAVGLGLLDDLSYGAGVWKGALGRRRLVALLPAVGPIRPRRTRAAGR